MAIGAALGVMGLVLARAPAAKRAAPLEPIATDRVFQVLPAASSPRVQLAAAARALGRWTLDLAGVPVDGAALARLARTPADEPLERAAREQLRRPVDLTDFIYFLDDVLLAGQRGGRGKPVVLSPSRARRSGVFLHPDDVFKDHPHVYGDPSIALSVEPPADPAVYAPPKDGAHLGPSWSARYPNPDTEPEQLAALRAARPDSDFAARIRALVDQLRAQGAEVSIGSTVRSPARGYLMWGAAWLSHAKSAHQVKVRARTLARVNARWGLHVPIRWRLREGWRTTVTQARKMAEAYQVVFATRRGAHRSHHYQGRAVDLTAVDLPRTLTLRAPDGAQRTFDLSAASQSRDLSLTPELIDWIEPHFGLSKLQSDYPHWDDAR